PQATAAAQHAARMTPATLLMISTYPISAREDHPVQIDAWRPVRVAADVPSLSLSPQRWPIDALVRGQAGSRPRPGERLATWAAMAWMTAAAGWPVSWRPSRRRTATRPLAASLAPITAAYGILASRARRIRAPRVASAGSHSARSPAARAWPATDPASAACSLVTGSTTSWTGASQGGNAPSYRSIRYATIRSIEDSTPRWIITGRCRCPSGPV